MEKIIYIVRHCEAEGQSSDAKRRHTSDRISRFSRVFGN